MAALNHDMQGALKFSALEELNAIGIALSVEKDAHRLLENILNSSKSLTNADGGTLYSVVEGELCFDLIRTDSLGLSMGGIGETPIAFDPIPLSDEKGQENLKSVAAFSAIRQQTVNIRNAYEEDGFDFSGPKAFDAEMNYLSKSFLTIPMQNHEGDVIGVLQLVNKIHPGNGKVVPFDHMDQQLAESLASQAAIILTNRRLIDDLENLFRSFIKLIATAIDEKSPHTAAHCERVPALTMMLADSVSKVRHGPMASFHLDEQERNALDVASWLHDCGKITTPEHIVEKSTKLETIFDRISLVDTRFEVLKRDAEIRKLRQLQVAKDECRKNEIEARYEQDLAQIEQERDFIRRCNIGSEKMCVEDQERVREISKRTWMNPEGELGAFLTDNEVHNLTIPKGSLTAEERQIINNHIVATIKMLESLPFPKHLVNVPEYAGGHHEKMDGTGYPKGLTREQMSVPARVMAIADVFEALTAKERPYKDGMRLSQALNILGKMKQDHHIDPDIFDIFLSEGVFLEYAREHLDDVQIDIEKPEDIPGYPFQLA